MLHVLRLRSASSVSTGFSNTSPNTTVQESLGPSAAASKAFFHPELDVLRFCAFLLVFVAHCSVSPERTAVHYSGIQAIIASAIGGAGFSGLALFFTLSSYLITELLLREQDRTQTIHRKAFYLRRIIRIWPLYFFFLLVVRPIASRYLPGEHLPISAYMAFSLLVGNWFCYYLGFPPSIATPLWSISVEEQFYLLWPILVSRCRRHIPAIAMAMLLIANISRTWLVLYPRPDPALWCSTLTRLDPFALGALLAFFLHGRDVRLGQAARLLSWCTGALLLLFLGRSGAHNGEIALLFYPLEAVACCSLLIATLRPAGSWKPGKLGRPITYLGRISYGLYVYHLMMLTLVGRFLHISLIEQEISALLGSVLLASASYVLLESPFLKLKQRFTYVPSRP